MHTVIAGLVLFCGLAAVSAQSVKLSWNPNPESNIAGYIVHYGTESGNLTEFINVGNQTTTTLESLPQGVPHYAAVQAYDTLDQFSDLSAEISFVPHIKPPVLVKNQTGAAQPDAGSTLDFGMVRLGAISETRSFTITNTGTTPLTGLRINIDNAVAGNFSITGIPVKLLLTTNGSFEQDLDNWSFSGNVISNTIGSATNGSKVAQFSDRNRANDGVLSQSFATTPGVTYQLAFDVGVFSFNTSPQLLRTTIRGQQTLVSDDYTLSGTGGGNKVWIPRTLEFTADSASTTISFTDISTFTNSLDLLVDHVRVIDPTPPTPPAGPQITTLAPGKSATFTVTFKPTAAGARETVLSLIADDVPVVLYETNLAGAGSVQFDAWLAENGVQDGPTGNSDEDALSNLQEYAFGTNAKSPHTGAVSVGSGQVVARGTPAALVLAPEDGGFQGLFARRRDHASVNLRYMPQFSSDLIQWVDATALPAALGIDGEMELVAVSAPGTINGMPARFFRVGVGQSGTPNFPQWLAEHTAGAASDNPDGDALSNLQEFAFGTDPKITQAGTAAETSGLLASRGAPSVRVRNAPGKPDFEFNGLYCRRKDRTITGITYKPQFSVDLRTWHDAAASPATLADDGEIEVVSVRAPENIGGDIPRFFRVGVDYRP